MKKRYAASAVTVAVSALLVACGGGGGAGTGGTGAQSPMTAGAEGEAALMKMSAMSAAEVPTVALTVLVTGGQGRVYSVPNGLDCETSTCVGNIPQNTVVSLRAVPAPGFAFDRWEANGICSDHVSCNVNLSSARTVTARFVPVDPLAACDVTRSNAAAPVIATTRPKLLLANAELKACLQDKYARGTPEAMRLKSLVDTVVAGARPYNFSPWFAALVYQMSGEVRYRDVAIARMDEIITAEEALIAAGGYPAVHGNSYLGVDWYLGNLARVYDWAYDGLTEQQKARWIAYGNQAMWNVWKAPGNATSGMTGQWGGRNHRWSGWATDNPANNYYRHFINAGMQLGLATHGDNPQAQEWLDIFRNQKIERELIPLLNAKVQGGGSTEGTGYGVSTRTLWTVYDTWERSTGERLADKTPHTLASIAQEIHTITPTLDRRAVVGDSTRSVTGELHDYNRDYLQQLIALYPNERLSGVARNVVNNSSVPRMRYDYDYYADVLHGLPKASVTPEVDRSALATTYWGEGTGNLMMRSDWKTDATYGHFQCGRYDESHAHADQGSFMLFKNDWLAYDSLQRSLSGTEQFMSLHNLMRLNMPDGAEVQMMPNTQPCRVMALADNPRYTYMAADLTPVYSWRHGDYARHQNKQNDRVKKVQREFLFIRPSTFVVLDRVETTVPTKQSWLLNTPVAPVAQGGEITVNNNGNTLRVQTLAPTNAETAVVASTFWNADRSASRDWWRAEVSQTGTANVFLHVMDTNGAVLSATRADAEGQVGARIQLADGRVATARFAINALGGTLDVQGANGEVQVAGALPATIAPPPVFAGDPPPAPRPAPQLYSPIELNYNATSAPPTGSPPPPAPPSGPAPSPAPGPAPAPAPADPQPEPTPAPQPVAGVLELRQGLNGYQGVTDVGVSNQGAQYNYGKGVVVPTGKTGAFRIDGSSGYEMRSFVRFAGLQTLAGRRVTRAELALTFTFGASGYTLNGMVLDAAWNPLSPKFGWTQRNGASQWAALGSGGTDWNNALTFQITGFNSAAADTRRVNLNPAVVQKWIDQPQNNHGFVLVPTVSGKTSFMRDSSDGTELFRPTLKLWFE